MENMTLDFAKSIAEFAETLVKNEYGDNPFSVAVVDKDGFTILYQKKDGAKLLTIALTPAKAYNSTCTRTKYVSSHGFSLPFLRKPAN